MKVALIKDGFALKGGWFYERRRRWEAVRAVHAIKMDKMTYEEDFLVLSFGEARSVSVGELDKGFAAFQAALVERLPGFDTDWQTKTATSAAGVMFRVWGNE
jgi:hypothetical protein